MKAKDIVIWQIWAALLLIALNFFAATPVMAQEPPNKESAGSGQIIDLLLQKGIITQQEAEALKQRPADATTSKGEGEAISPKRNADDADPRKEIERLEKKVDQQIDDVQSKTRINAREIERLEKERIDKLAEESRKTSWAQRIAFDGDIRLRYEKIYFDEFNNDEIIDPSGSGEYLNSTIDRERVRARVRLGLKADIIDPREVNAGKLQAAVRLATGDTSNPVSTNDTLGDYNNKDDMVLDRYFLKYSYKPLLPKWGRSPQLDVLGGRMPNPWFSSDLVWDDDLNFEGLAFEFKTDTLEENGWHIFLTGGAFPLQEKELSSDDKWLYAGQIGFAAAPFYGLKLTMGAAYYDYQNIEAQIDAVGLDGFVSPGVPNESPPDFVQYGNTMVQVNFDPDNPQFALASDYDILDLTLMADIDYFFPVHIILSGTYAKNLAFDGEELTRKWNQPYTIPDEDQAYRLALKVGYPVIINFGEWNWFLEYKYIEKDAVVDAFNDSDFHYYGGTDAKGWIAGLELGLYRNLWLRTRWITTDSVEDENQFSVDTLQVDLNARF
jgi:hypothetical protein